MRVCVCACLNGELLLKEWAENWKNWLVALAHRQNGYRLSAEHAGEVLLHQLLEESCAPTSRSVPRRGSAGYCAFSETWHFAERTVTCLRDPWLENLSSLPPPLTLSCEIGLIGTNCPPWSLSPLSSWLWGERVPHAAAALHATRGTKEWEPAEQLLPRNTNTAVK